MVKIVLRKKDNQRMVVFYIQAYLKSNYAILDNIALKVALGRIAFPVNSGLGW